MHVIHGKIVVISDMHHCRFFNLGQELSRPPRLGYTIGGWVTHVEAFIAWLGPLRQALKTINKGFEV